MKPELIEGSIHKDARGSIAYNNIFSECLTDQGIKKVFTLRNTDTVFVRAWQGHAVEQRWFSALTGKFKVLLIEIDDWENPSPDLPQLEYVLTADQMDILHIPAGYASSIQALDECSVLLVMADYAQGELQDEYRFPPEYFKEKQNEISKQICK